MKIIKFAETNKIVSLRKQAVYLGADLNDSKELMIYIRQNSPLEISDVLDEILTRRKMNKAGK